MLAVRIADDKTGPQWKLKFFSSVAGMVGKDIAFMMTIVFIQGYNLRLEITIYYPLLF